MNLRDLNYLIAAADTQHFGRAAERCHVSQPTLSGQIKKLEETLGLMLFERCNRSVVLTDAGREITMHARRILEEVRLLESLAQSRQDPLVGDIRIGIIPTLCAYLLPHLLPLLHERFPDMHPILFEETSEVLVGRLLAHDIDVALLATQPADDSLVEQLLFDEPLWLALPATHPRADQLSIDLMGLLEDPLLLLAEGHCLADRVREICPLPASSVRSADLRATSLETLLQLVGAGQGVTLVPQLAVRHSLSNGSDLRFIRLNIERGFRQIRLVHRRSTSRQAALDAFGAVVQTAVAD